MARLVILFAGTILTALHQPAQAQIDSAYSPTLSTRFLPLSSNIPKAKTLLKYGASIPLLRQSSFTNYYAMIGLEGIVEQKVVGGVAIVGGIETNVGFSLNGQYTRYLSLEMPIALRYYFSLTRREKQRLDRHSFLSNYVALQTSNVLVSSVNYDPQSGNDLQNYYRGQVGRAITNNGRVGDLFLLLNYAYFQIGTQRRVFKRYYIDVNGIVPIAYLIYNRTEYTLATPGLINIKIGLGGWR